MSDVAIRVENLGKRYRIGKAQQQHDTLRDAFAATLHGSARRLSSAVRRPPSAGRNPAANDDQIWALKDVSFEVKRGEVVGIIGRNGAGKSTLLKILSRITDPTEGRAEIHGRVGSLLEVGTGFHPELTGRENIYLSGAILGMRRAEIDRRFAEIVAFSGVEKFIDTPIKRYSSGMNVRLGFAVAAHLEPEILLVDEVLAVGDAAFQRKCLGKMGQVAGQGRTVVFVSHNMTTILALCTSAIALRDGTIAYAGKTSDAITAYLASLNNHSTSDLSERYGDEEPESLAWYTGIRFESRPGSRVATAICGQSLDIILSYRTKKENAALDFGIGVYTMMGEKVLYFSTRFSNSETAVLFRCGEVVCRIPKLPVPEGSYRLNISLRHNKMLLDLVEGAAILGVEGGDFYGTGKIPPASENKILADHSWIFPRSADSTCGS